MQYAASFARAPYPDLLTGPVSADHSDASMRSRVLASHANELYEASSHGGLPLRYLSRVQIDYLQILKAKKERRIGGAAGTYAYGSTQLVVADWSLSAGRSIAFLASSVAKS